MIAALERICNRKSDRTWTMHQQRNRLHLTKLHHMHTINSYLLVPISIRTQSEKVKMVNWNHEQGRANKVWMPLVQCVKLSPVLPLLIYGEIQSAHQARNLIFLPWFPLLSTVDTFYFICQTALDLEAYRSCVALGQCVRTANPWMNRNCRLITDFVVCYPVDSKWIERQNL